MIYIIVANYYFSGFKKPQLATIGKSCHSKCNMADPSENIEAILKENIKSAGVSNSKILASQQASKLPRLIALIQETWTMYKTLFPLFIGAIIIPSILLLIINMPIYLTNVQIQQPLGLPRVAESPQYSYSMMIISIISIIIYLYGHIAFLVVISHANKRIGIINAYKIALSYLIPYCGIFVLKYFLIFGAYIPFIIPGIIFSVWFSLAGILVVMENEKWTWAIFKSREYIRGYFWPFIGR